MPQIGRFFASRGARPIRRACGLAMGEARSGCRQGTSSCVGGRRRHDIDGIGLESIPVGGAFGDEWHALCMVPLPLPLLPRAMTLPRFDSHCAGTPSAASPRCWGVLFAAFHRPWWAGQRVLPRWALRQSLALLATVVFISMVLATLDDQFG